MTWNPNTPGYFAAYTSARLPQRGGVRDRDHVALEDDIEPVECGRPRRDRDVGIAGEVARLALLRVGREIHGPVEHDRRLVARVDQLERFDAERAESVSLLANVVGLADVVGARDVFYVLLAISRACPLLTCDLRLARAAARLGVEVIAVDRAEPA